MSESFRGPLSAVASGERNDGRAPPFDRLEVVEPGVLVSECSDEALADLAPASMGPMRQRALCQLGFDALQILE